jgi:Caudovirus prohead serine protease
MEERFRAEVSPVSVSQTNGRYKFKGVASTVGNVDRMRRVFLPGAFPTGRLKVPLLVNHDPDQVLGSSTLIPQGSKLLHESSVNPKARMADEFISLLEEGDIASTSISWIAPEAHRFYGWTDLKRKNPELAKSAAAAGVTQQEDALYFAGAEIVENSVVAIPANDRALIGAAALVGDLDRGFIESMREVASIVPVIERETAAGSRHNTADRASIQVAHDALVNLGATCTVTPEGTTDVEDNDDAEDRLKMNEAPPLGGWTDHMNPNAVPATVAERSTLPVPDLPIDDNQSSIPLPAELDDLGRELAALEAVFTA